MQVCGRIVRLRVICLLFCAIRVFYLLFYFDAAILSYAGHTSNLTDKARPHQSPPAPFELLVNGSGCKIRTLDPFVADSVAGLEHYNITTCGAPSITYAEQSEEDVVTLHVNRSLVSRHVKCHYRQIYWNWKRSDGVRWTNEGNRLLFPDNLTLTIPQDWEFVLVVCLDLGQWHREMHAFARKKELPEVRHGADAWNVVLYGIDSVSRSNLIRVMPKTYEYLRVTSWFEMQGYNKIGENTLPNLMAVLTGLSPAEAKSCISRTPGALEKCPFIWNNFKLVNYSTAYAEDMSELSTFHNGYSGFSQQPTDYYWRPFSVALENKVTSHPPFFPNLHHLCKGNKFYVDYMNQWASDIARVNQEHPYFALYWSNSYSHDTSSIPAVIDDKVQKQLESMTDNRTVIVFFSDHGIRYGPTRLAEAGYFEERLPFLFVYLPPAFQDKHPGLSANMRANRNRLTTPHDLHLTLKHVLSLTDPSTNVTAKGCPKCQSLFSAIPDSRTCQDVNIDPFWCTCSQEPFRPVSAQESLEIVQDAMETINRHAEKHVLCAKLHLKAVRSVRAMNESSFLASWETLPGTGIYEAILRKRGSKYEVHGEFSRISQYAEESWCVTGSVSGWDVKKSCYCTYLRQSQFSFILIVVSSALILSSAIFYVIIRSRRRYLSLRKGILLCES